MSKKNDIIPAFLGALVMLPLLLLFILQVYQWQLKRTAKQRLKDENAQTIRLAADKVVWEKKGKEIILDGKMFDIRTYSIRNGIFTATGYFDIRETMIRDFLAHHTGNLEKTASLIQLLVFAQCFVAMIGWLMPRFLLGRMQKRIAFFHCHYSKPHISIICPPPRLH